MSEVKASRQIYPEVTEHDRDVLGNENKPGKSVSKQIRKRRHSVQTSLVSCFQAEVYLDLFFSVQHSFDCDLCVFESGHQHSEEFGKLSAVKKVPVMKDGGFILTERFCDMG